MFHKNLPVLITAPKHCSASILSLRSLSLPSKCLNPTCLEGHLKSIALFPGAAQLPVGKGKMPEHLLQFYWDRYKTEARFSLEKSLSQTSPLSLLGQNFALAFASTKECRCSTHFCIHHNEMLSHRMQYPLLREGEKEQTNHGICLVH